ncbi:MAG: hypothetical protein QXM16_03825 [Nitrososphaerota archaeon]
MRLKLLRTAWQSLNIPDKGEYIGVIRGRYDITAGWRLRIPNMYKSLFYLEANEGREVRIALWVEDGIPCFGYEEYGKSLFIPSGRQPRYDGGEWYCSRGCQTFSNRDKCPNCNRVLRKKPRRKRNKSVQEFLTIDS